MKAIPLVVADTTPLNYLAILGETEILGRLFDEVCIPEAVWRELSHPNAPAEVTAWLQAPPVWLRVVQVHQFDTTIRLGDGENEAISLAKELNSQLVLLDERRGRRAAEQRGLVPLGTLNLIDLADDAGLVDGLTLLQALSTTTFRASAELLLRFQQKLSLRRKSA